MSSGQERLHVHILQLTLDVESDCNLDSFTVSAQEESPALHGTLLYVLQPVLHCTEKRS